MKTCIIIDDSRATRKVARLILESFHFSCEEAENGQIAFDLCQRKMPLLILLDWNMPVMDGLTFLKMFRKLPNTQKTLVIFCSTANDVKNIYTALNSGANEYIMKPFDADIIRDKLRHLDLIEI